MLVRWGFTARAARVGLVLLAVLSWAVVAFVAPAPAAEARPAQAASDYTNPVSTGRLQDPFIVRDGGTGTYYAYVSGFDFGFPFYVFARKSTDLVSWTDVGAVLSGPGAWADAATGLNVTSPSVVNVPTNTASQRWIMYYSARKSGSPTKCIGLATASSPEGTFTPNDTPLICPPAGAEDPSAFTPYTRQLVYKSGTTIYNQVLTDDGLGLNTGAGPFALYTAKPGWWQQGVVDRPAVAVGQDGAQYLFFSGGPQNTTQRAMGWAPCSQTWTVATDCSSQTQLGTWIEGGANLAAPSGAQVFHDAQGAQWITYDARPGGGCTTTSCSQNPYLRIDKLCFAHGMPRTNAPTTTLQSLARVPGDCSADIPGGPLSIQPSDVTDDGTVGSLALDGNISTAAHGRALWVYGDRFDCGNRDSNWGGYGVPNASAPGPWFVEDKPCPHQGAVPKTAIENEYDTLHWVDCTAPCLRSRIVMWSSGAIGTPDGGAWITFEKALEFWAKTAQGQPRPNETICQTPGGCWDFDNWTGVGIGAARLTKADVDADIAVADRSSPASPVACAETADTAEGCLFDINVDPMGSDSFSKPIADGNYVYMLSSYHFDWGSGTVMSRPKIARAPIDQIDNPAAWRYWKGPGENGWTTTNNYAEAAVVPTSDLVVGTVSYNPYLDRFVNISDFIGTVFIRTAPSLTGTWSAPQTVLTGVECPEDPEDPREGFWWSRTFAQHASLATGGGRTLPITYFRTGFGDCPHQLRWATVKLD